MYRLALMGSGAALFYPLADYKIKLYYQETVENMRLISSTPSLSDGIFIPTP